MHEGIDTCGRCMQVCTGSRAMRNDAIYCCFIRIKLMRWTPLRKCTIQRTIHCGTVPIPFFPCRFSLAYVWCVVHRGQRFVFVAACLLFVSLSRTASVRSCLAKIDSETGVFGESDSLSLATIARMSMNDGDRQRSSKMEIKYCAVLSVTRKPCIKLTFSPILISPLLLLFVYGNLDVQSWRLKLINSGKMSNHQIKWVYSIAPPRKETESKFRFQCDPWWCCPNFSLFDTSFWLIKIAQQIQCTQQTA